MNSEQATSSRLIMYLIAQGLLVFIVTSFAPQFYHRTILTYLFATIGVLTGLWIEFRLFRRVEFRFVIGGGVGYLVGFLVDTTSGRGFPEGGLVNIVVALISATTVVVEAALVAILLSAVVALTNRKSTKRPKILSNVMVILATIGFLAVVVIRTS